MKKRMIAGMMLLVLTVSGCSAVSTAPTTINELAEETRAEAETESTDSILSSESEKADTPVESKAPEETESPESTAAPETAASQPIAEGNANTPEPAAVIPSKDNEQPAATVSSESKQPTAETTPAPTEQPQTAQQEPQETQQPIAETPPPAPPQPTAAPEETKPKTAYDYEFDIAAIKTVVAFETLYRDKLEVCAHADIEDKDQTVTFGEKPEIKTTAAVDGEKKAEPKGEVTIKDTVTRLIQTVRLPQASRRANTQSLPRVRRALTCRSRRPLSL